MLAISRTSSGLGILIGLLCTGCGMDLQVILADAVTELRNAAGTVQDTDPRDVALPDSLEQSGDTIIIDQSVNVIVNVEQDLTVAELPNSTVLGFDNQSGFDIYVRYLADGELQGVYVYDGETLLLDYPCLSDIELLSEDDIDPGTGVLVDSLELFEVYVNPDDFICGDALILPFEPASIEISLEILDLWP
jgi:hypothetical protein